MGGAGAMEFAAENVLFWEAIELLHSMAHQAIHPTRRSIFMEKKQNSQEMLESIKKRVKSIYSKFIEPKAPLEINLPSDIYQEIQVLCFRIISIHVSFIF